MVKKKLKVEWHPEAKVHFIEILKYLQQESEMSVSIVGNAILDTIERLVIHPYANPLDRFKKHNDGNYRAYMVYRYRISYYVDGETIYILRIRHTSREPLEY